MANAVPELKKENVKVLMTEAKFVTKSGTTSPSYVAVLGVKAHEGQRTTLQGDLRGLCLLLFMVIGRDGFSSAFASPAGRSAPRARTQDG